MNRESLYLEIGNIDDDLIQEASKVHGHKKHRNYFVRFVAAAACFCLICTGMFLGQRKDTIYFNELETPVTSKVRIPADENTTIHILSYQELFDYYGLEQFPDELPNLHRLEQSQYYIYQDLESILYDTNVLQYQSVDGGQTLSIVIAKETPSYEISGENVKQSQIDGVALVLATSKEFAEGTLSPVYWAEICNQEIYLRIVSYGMDEDSFINIIRELIKSQKK